MEIDELKKDFEEAVLAKPYASSLALVAFGLVAGVLFCLGILGLFVATLETFGANNAMSASFGLYGVIATLIIMAQGASVSLLVSLAKDARDTNRIIRLVAVSIMKRRNP